MKPITLLGGGTALAVLAMGMLAVTRGDATAANLFPYDDPVAVAEGKVLYDGLCASCHGANLEGQENWRIRGDDGLLPAPPHDETGHTWHHPDAQLFMIVKHGTAALVGNGYQSSMIGFGDQMTDEEILKVMAFIKSTWSPELIDAHDGINAEAAKQ